MTLVTFSVLGPVEVCVRDADGVRRPALPAKVRVVLAALLLAEGRFVSIDQLRDALWGEHPPATAHKVLQLYISQLRREIGPGLIETRPRGYAMAVSEGVLDAAEFERLLRDGRAALDLGDPVLGCALLDRALGLWRGEAFADLLDEPFAAVASAHLAEQRLDALEARTSARLELGQHDDILIELPKVVAEHPLREALRVQLAVALYRSDRQGDALAVCAEGRRVLREELGLDPGPRLQEVEVAILRQDPGLDVAVTVRLGAALPNPATSLIGRDGHVAAVTARLRERSARLVTVLGPGGIGKTRVAVAAAHHVASAFADGVAFVDLAATTDTDGATSTVRAALNPDSRTASASPLDDLARFLAGRDLLLVLDNLEQIPAFGDVVGHLLNAAPRLVVLATSRTRLRVSAEHVVDLPPLGLPEGDTGHDVEALLDVAAVRLLYDRARAVDDSFAITRANAGAVADLCVRLEGIPLAIELAAARLRSLTVDDLVTHLSRRLAVLGDGAWDLPVRQRTLRSTIAWSVDLLPVEARAALGRISAFAGGFTFEAASSVIGEDRVLDTLFTLVDSSLVRREDGRAGHRYAMFEAVREHAAELETSDEAARAAQAHATYFAELAERAEPMLLGPDQASWFDRLEADLDNLRVALRWWERVGHADRWLAMAASLARFWYVRGHLAEGRLTIERALAASPGESAARAKALRSASAIAVIQGDYIGALELAQRGLDAYRAYGDRVGEQRSLSNLGAILLSLGEPDRADVALDESIRLARLLPDRRALALALNNQGDVALTRDALDRAVDRFTESLALLEELGDTSNVARSHYNLGATLLRTGDAVGAGAQFAKALKISHALGDWEDVVWCLIGISAIAVAGWAFEAAAFIGAATALLERIDGSMKPFERAFHDRTMTALRSSLDNSALERATAEGRAVSVDEIVERALRFVAPGSEGGGLRR